MEPPESGQQLQLRDAVPEIYRVLYSGRHNPEGTFETIQIPIAYCLYRIKNYNDSEYKISMGMFKIILNANKSNPVTRNLTNIINQ